MTTSSLSGVSFLDHTADVGLEARASSREELFRRAARGTLALVEGEDGEGEGPHAESVAEARRAAEAEVGRAHEERELTLEADDPPGLLRAWLRELLWWHEVDGLAFQGADFEALKDGRLEATVALAPAGEAVREIKGVTLHGLRAERRDGEWWARVIFDV